MQIKNKLKDKTEIELCLSAQNAKEKAYSLHIQNLMLVRQF